MINRIIKKGRNILFEPQATVLSAALVIMVLVVFSQILGFVSKRILLGYFDAKEYSLFFAAFRLPELLFEVLALGVFSSAFIPVFAKNLKLNPKEAFSTASNIVSIGMLTFFIVSLVFAIFSYRIYSLIAPGYSIEETILISNLAKILFASQGVFVVSYVLTGVLESSKRFIVPALAPALYNIGIIIGTIVFSKSYGLYGPAYGVVIGSLLHLAVQLPFAMKLGFSFRIRFKLDDNVKKVGKLALPRIIELSILQIQKTAELFFASLISVSSYAYLSLAGSLAAFPVNLLGISLAKAALPTLARESENKKAFFEIYKNTFYQMMYLIAPVVFMLIVLRIPLVRLLFGADKFNWEATVQTGYVLSAFAIAIPVQAAIALTSRAFYALHETKTPVIVAIIDVAITVLLQFLLIYTFKLPVWSLAFSSSISAIFQFVTLNFLLRRKFGKFSFPVSPVLKIFISSLFSGGVMFFLLKTLDRSVWIKRLSFLSTSELPDNLPFESFVLDTRYTINLAILTLLSAVFGLSLYLLINYLLGTSEQKTLFRVIRNRTKLSFKSDEQLVLTEK